MLLDKSQQSIHAVDGIAPHLFFFVQVLAQFAVFFFQRHLRGDSGLKFGVETPEAGLSAPKGPVPAFQVALVLP